MRGTATSPADLHILLLDASMYFLYSLVKKRGWGFMAVLQKARFFARGGFL
jgi:hypothetical protein